MKLLLTLIIVSVIFMTAGSLFAIPNINAGVFTYSEIFGNLILGDIVACIFWLFVYFERN